MRLLLSLHALIYSGHRVLLFSLRAKQIDISRL